MDSEFQTWIETWIQGAGGFWSAIALFSEGLLLRYRLVQLGVALVLAAVAWLVARGLNARMEDWIRSHEGWKTWQLRWLIRLRRLLPLIAYVVLIWAAVAVFAAIYQFPSRRYLLVLIGTIASA